MFCLVCDGKIAGEDKFFSRLENVLFAIRSLVDGECLSLFFVFLRQVLLLLNINMRIFAIRCNMRIFYVMC